MPSRWRPNSRSGLRSSTSATSRRRRFSELNREVANLLRPIRTRRAAAHAEALPVVRYAAGADREVAALEHRRAASSIVDAVRRRADPALSRMRISRGSTPCRSTDARRLPGVQCLRFSRLIQQVIAVGQVSIARNAELHARADSPERARKNERCAARPPAVRGECRPLSRAPRCPWRPCSEAPAESAGIDLRHASRSTTIEHAFDTRQGGERLLDRARDQPLHFLRRVDPFVGHLDENGREIRCRGISRAATVARRSGRRARVQRKRDDRRDGSFAAQFRCASRSQPAGRRQRVAPAGIAAGHVFRSSRE